MVAAFEHEGPAQRLVHHLKYSGVDGYPEMVADMVSERIPRAPLVPVPRALSRRYRYGIDPARAIADSIAARKGVPVWPLLASPIHTPRRAGGDHRRPVERYRRRRQRHPWAEVIVVDDVVTTGRTVLAAAHSVGLDRVTLVVAANIASTVSSLFHPDL